MWEDHLPDFVNHNIGRKVPYLEGSLTGALAVTDSRIVAYAFRKCQVHAAFYDDRTKQIEFSVVNDGNGSSSNPKPVMSIRLDASLFHPKWSGTIEIRFRTNNADQICKRVRSGIL
jgi:hypothetical protein